MRKGAESVLKCNPTSLFQKYILTALSLPNDAATIIRNLTEIDLEAQERIHWGYDATLFDEEVKNDSLKTFRQT